MTRDRKIPIIVDEDRFINMRTRTFVVTVGVIVSVTSVCVLFNRTLSDHTVALTEIKSQINGDHETLLKQGQFLKDMDRKLDYITHGKRGDPPSSTPLMGSNP